VRRVAPFGDGWSSTARPARFTERAPGSLHFSRRREPSSIGLPPEARRPASPKITFFFLVILVGFQQVQQDEPVCANPLLPFGKVRLGD
jgi:hypothetical protein